MKQKMRRGANRWRTPYSRHVLSVKAASHPTSHAHTVAPTASAKCSKWMLCNKAPMFNLLHFY